jgi:hypothetical protein
MGSHNVKVFAFVLIATVLEASGDAVVRLALHHQSAYWRAALFILGTVLLALYGTSLNLAPVDFATVTGLYVASVFIAARLLSASPAAVEAANSPRKWSVHDQVSISKFTTLIMFPYTRGPKCPLYTPVAYQKSQWLKGKHTSPRFLMPRTRGTI